MSSTATTVTVSQQGSNYVSSSSQVSHSAFSVIQSAINSMRPGSVLTISRGNYKINAGLIDIPNVGGLTIQGEGIDATVLDATANAAWNDGRSAQLSIIGRSNEDPAHPKVQIPSLTMRNFRILSAYTTTKYLSGKNDGISAIRADNVDNLTIENIHTDFVGVSVQCRNVKRGLIRGIKTYNCGAGPTLANNNQNITVDNCYSFRTFDDSFACLGSQGVTTNILFNNCIADKGSSEDSSSPGIGASCYKLDTGASPPGRIASVRYVNCTALNNIPPITRSDGPAGGFFNGDPKVAGPIIFENCNATNCKIGFLVAGQSNQLINCSAIRCTTPILTVPGSTQPVLQGFRRA